MSSKSKPSTPEKVLPAGALLALRSFLIIAIVVGSYLLWVSLGGMAVAGCGPESNCDKVLHSRWAYWLGLPVSALALLIYGAAFAGTLWLGRHVPVVAQRQAWKFLIPCAIAMVGAAIWFTALQVFAIKAVCPFCMAAHGAGLVAASIILFTAPLRNAPDKPWQVEKQVFIPPAAARKVSLAAVVGLALLVSGQVLHKRKTFAVVAAPTNSPPPLLARTSAPPMAGTTPPAATASNFPPPVASAPASAPSQPAISLPPRGDANALFQIYGGMFSFDLREVPVIGNASAPYKMVSLFDYTCHHCQIMHGHLMQTHKALSNELAIISLPMPLDGACNPAVKRTPSVHSNACEYARIGLGLWRANRNAHAQFDDWVFAGQHPPPLPQTREYAMQLAGSTAFEKASQDPWVNEQIQRGIAIYSTNMIHVGNGAMPQLIIGNRLASGTLNGVEDLFRLLAENLGLKKQP